MALLESRPPEIGSSMPDFKLESVEGKTYSASDFSENNGLVVMFLCGHCPYVLAVEDRILDLARRYQEKGIGFVAICSNDPAQNEKDKPEALLERVKQKDYPFPYLIDDTQEIARKFDAVCTPDIFVYDQNRNLYYHGRIDDSPKDPSAATSHDLRNALEKLIKNEAPPSEQVPSMGCSIKWKGD